jgi:hypothetical protein
MEQNKQPVERYYYSEKEWARIGCGPLPLERDRSRLVEQKPAQPTEDKQ